MMVYINKKRVMRLFYYLVIVCITFYSCDMSNTVNYTNISLEVQKESCSKENLLSALIDMTSFLELDSTSTSETIMVTYKILKGTAVIKNILIENPELFSEVKKEDINDFLTRYMKKNNNLEDIEERKKIVEDLLNLNFNKKKHNNELFYSTYYDFLTLKAEESTEMMDAIMRISSLVHRVLFAK